MIDQGGHSSGMTGEVKVGAIDYALGGEDGDIIVGGSGADVIIGGIGQDRLIGNGGNDVIVGGFVNGAFGQTVEDLSEEYPSGLVFIQEPHPTFFAELLFGGAGNDVIIGGSWDDADHDSIVDEGELVLGSEDWTDSWGFNNIIWAGAGDDTAYGANGFDTIGGGAGHDVLYGFGGVDVIYGGTGNDTIHGGDNENTSLHRLEGGNVELVEQLYGGAGDDVIYGDAGADKIYGGAGDDKIYGGTGSDTLSGGAGEDVFLFGEGDGRDIITDFDVSEDRLVFSDIGTQYTVDQLVQNAVQTTVGEQSGLAIYLPGTGAVFLVGLTADDIGSISATNVLYLED